MTKEKMIDLIYQKKPFKNGRWYRGEYHDNNYCVYSKDVLILVIGDFIHKKTERTKDCPWNSMPWILNMQYFSTVASSLQNLIYSCEYKGKCLIVCDTEEEFLQVLEEEL